MSRLVVSISHVEFTETDQTFYVVKVTQDNDEWQVRRAYSDFRHLRDDVARVLKDDKHQLVGDDAAKTFAREFHALAFPGKRLFGSKKDHVVKDRAVALHHFLIKLLFLTHTFRKAQKQLYDAPTVVPHDAASLVARPHGSATIFYLLRDFLKPVRPSVADTGARPHGRAHHSDDDGDDHARRLLRESKMLAMRASQHQQQPPKAKSAPQLLQGSPVRPRNGSTPRRAAPPPPPPQPMAAEAVAAAARMGASPPSRDADPAMTRRSVHFQSNTDDDDNNSHATPRSKTLHIAALAKPRAASTASVSSASSAAASPTRVSKRNDRISSNEHQPVLRAIDADLHIVESVPDPQPRSLSSSSTASSTASLNARSQDALGNNSRTSSALSSSFNEGGASARRRPRSKKKNLSSSMSSLSRAEKEMRNSERLSRLTPQLTAQTITVDAQKELEKHVSEYNAIMIMRYVDRFISKAVGKTPGCYTVMENRLVIDSARFVQELEDVFHDLPSNFQDAFRNASGEWIIPKALDAYVQLKWDSFQGCNTASGRDNGTSSGKGSKASTRKNSKAAMSDSDDSDSDSEYETTTQFNKKKTRAFTQEESDVLQMMIAEGTAGNDQMLRLRRQNDEMGWHRRTMPGAKYDNGSDTDEDDNENGSGNESIKRFQEMQNAMRKSRMSRHDDVGGLV